MLGEKAQVSIEYMILLSGVIVLATAIYFVNKGLTFKGRGELNETHQEAQSGVDGIFNASQAVGEE